MSSINETSLAHARREKEDDALRFWTESLYHYCLADSDLSCRERLARSILDLADNDLRLPPSLLGANTEALPPRQQLPSPSPADPRHRVVNLSNGGNLEILVVNPAQEPPPLQWDRAPVGNPAWSDAGQAAGDSLQTTRTVPARSFLLGRATLSE